MLALKTWWSGANTIFGSSYNFQGVSLLLNAGMTIAGLALGSTLFSEPADEQVRTAEFFRGFTVAPQPKVAEHAPPNPVGPPLAAATTGMGALIVFAGLISRASAARLIDSIVGLILVAIGLLLWRGAHKAELRARIACKDLSVG
jgi:hypothetical protein